MLSKKLSFLFMTLSVGLLFSCEKDDPKIPDEPELITNVELTLTSTDGDVVQLTFEDLDGDGGNNPVITGGTLKANTIYQGAVTLSNEAEDPAEDITEEVEEEKEEHQFFFLIDGLDLTITYNDMDADNNPVGLTTTLATGSASSGTLTVILRHEPDKSADGVSAGDISNAGGETDIEVEFPITIE